MLFDGLDVTVEQAEVLPEAIVVSVVSTSRPGRCPDCRQRAKRQHSTYLRSLAERPVASRQVTVLLRVRRFFCDRKTCPRKTFAEQVDGLTEPFRRSSTRLTGWLRHVAAELGGRAGERLCRGLRLAAGRTRLLGMLQAPPVPERAPRVLGVDEFAFRKGCTYGTLLVDVEAGRVVDVLPDRTCETFAGWLRAHPGVEIVCRDRATAFTRAVREATPNAMEVADRWHLLQNLAAAVEKTCHQHRGCLRKGIEAKDEPLPRTEALTTKKEVLPMTLPPPELPRTQIIERTRHRHADIHRLLEKGWTISAVARRLNLDRKTVRRFRDTNLDQLLASAHERARPACWSRSSPTSTPASPTPRAMSAAPASSTRSANAATEAASSLSAGTSPPCARATPNPSAPTSPALARSPPGSCGPATPSRPAKRIGY